MLLAGSEVAGWDEAALAGALTGCADGGGFSSSDSSSLDTGLGTVGFGIRVSLSDDLEIGRASCRERV